MVTLVMAAYEAILRRAVSFNTFLDNLHKLLVSVSVNISSLTRVMVTILLGAGKAQW